MQDLYALQPSSLCRSTELLVVRVWYQAALAVLGRLPSRLGVQPSAAGAGMTRRVDEARCQILQPGDPPPICNMHSSTLRQTRADSRGDYQMSIAGDSTAAKCSVSAAATAVTHSSAPSKDQTNAPVLQATLQRTQPGGAARLVPHLHEKPIKVLRMRPQPSHSLMRLVPSSCLCTLSTRLQLQLPWTLGRRQGGDCQLTAARSAAGSTGAASAKRPLAAAAPGAVRHSSTRCEVAASTAGDTRPPCSCTCAREGGLSHE